METTLSRLKSYIDEKKLTIKEVESAAGLSQGTLYKPMADKDKKKSIGVDKLENILKAYPDLNPTWLLTGRGEMIIKEDELTQDQLLEKHQKQMEEMQQAIAALQKKIGE